MGTLRSLGMVPKGWTLKQLKKITTAIGDGIHTTPSYALENTSHFFINGNNLKNGKIVITSATKFVSAKEHERHRIHLNDTSILMSINGTIGNLAYYKNEQVVLGKSAAYLNIAPPHSKRFFYFVLESEPTQRFFRSELTGSTIRNLSLRTIRDTKVLTPPSEEQARIAEIISTWGEAIETAEKLIENSKAQKKALMQQLLTGKKRLPSFSGEWSETVLKKIATVLVSPVNKKSVAGEPAVRLCNYTDVYYNSHITNSLNFMTATASNSEVERFTLEKNDLIITKDSETPGDIAVPALVSEELDNVVCGYHLAIIRPDTEVVDSAFLNHLFSQPKVRHYFSTRANGATRFGLTIDGIKEASFVLPGIDEQQKIASVLDASDKELRYLNIVARQLTIEKRALMQQLLTGKRRVKVAA